MFKFKPIVFIYIDFLKRFTCSKCTKIETSKKYSVYLISRSNYKNLKLVTPDTYNIIKNFLKI